MKTVIVYTMNNCAYCEAAKKLLHMKGLIYQEINISEDDNQKAALMQKTGHRTMPQIFIDDQFIGGYTELKFFLNT